MKHFVLLTLIAISTASCGKDDLPDYTKLAGLRVLAIKAVPPEVDSGASVTVTPVLSDIEGLGRSITVTAEACADPGVAYGAEPSCTNATDKVTLSPAAVSLTSPLYTAATGAVTVTVPSSVYTSRTTLEQYNGVYYLVVFKFTAVGGPSVTAFKRILVSKRTTLNSNPSLSDLTVNSASLTSRPSDAVNIQPVISSGSEESYLALSSTGTYDTYTESLTTTWFASEGSFLRQRIEGTSTNYFTPGTIPTTHSTVLVVVVRDGRGGEDYVIRGI